MEHVGYGSLAAAGLDATFAAPTDPTRRAILARLAQGEASVAELAAPLAEATDWLERYRKHWEGNFQRLDALLDEMKARE